MISVEHNRPVHRLVRLINLLQDDTKFIVVAIVSNAVGWTMVNMMMMMMNESQFIVNNQRWVGDRLAVFVRAIMKECSCSMMLIAG